MSHLRATSGRRPHRAPRSAVVAQGLAPPAVVTLLVRTRVLVAGIMLSGRCPMDESQEVRPLSATLETDGSIEVDLGLISERLPLIKTEIARRQSFQAGRQ